MIELPIILFLSLCITLLIKYYIRKSVVQVNKMQLIEVEGDLIHLFKNKYFSIIAHGCNCLNIMGAGIASQIRNNFYEAFLADNIHYTTTSNKSDMLGNYSHVHIKELGIICNLYTQFSPGPNAKLEYIKQSLTNMLQDLVPSKGIMRIGIPLIGCGIGGLDYNKDLKPLLKSIVAKNQFPNVEIVVVHYKK